MRFYVLVILSLLTYRLSVSIQLVDADTLNHLDLEHLPCVCKGLSGVTKRNTLSIIKLNVSFGSYFRDPVVWLPYHLSFLYTVQ